MSIKSLGYDVFRMILFCPRTVAATREILLESSLGVLMEVFALNKEQRQAVDETGDVRPSSVEIVLHPQLAHAKKFVVFRRIEIEVPQPLLQVVGGGLLDEGVFGVVHASPFVSEPTANRFITRRTIKSLAFGSLSAISSVSAPSGRFHPGSDACLSWRR